MNAAIDNHWYPVAMISGIDAPRETLLLGKKISLGREDGSCWVLDASGA